jgi:hypothetical protein
LKGVLSGTSGIFANRPCTEKLYDKYGFVSFISQMTTVSLSCWRMYSSFWRTCLSFWST